MNALIEDHEVVSFVFVNREKRHSASREEGHARKRGKGGGEGGRKEKYNKRSHGRSLL